MVSHLAIHQSRWFRPAPGYDPAFVVSLAAIPLAGEEADPMPSRPPRSFGAPGRLTGHVG
jgi:hypothetical protein